MNIIQTIFSPRFIQNSGFLWHQFSGWIQHTNVNGSCCGYIRRSRWTVLLRQSRLQYRSKCSMPRR